MKKYFLLIVLFTVFLGLGNVSFVLAGLLCTNTPSVVTGNVYTCEYPNQPPSKCNNLGQTCPDIKDCGGGTKCCICNPAPVVPSPVVAETPTVLPVCAVGGKPSSGCTCPTATKNMDDVCKLCSDPGVCCGIALNTSVPFIGNCIEDSITSVGPGETSVTGATAFPTLMGSLTKILVTVILIVSFVLIIIGGIMIATGNPSGGKKMIINVVIGIALLGASGVILRLINPNFFG